ncbi:EF hand domain-containing protein [Nannizzia gypsea CBS 118893]|uniref:Actin cytoskeleton-regulatory complex protein END3 n=1 Tax=Arthroderma gypseum (strain ATCC MYA-4604 / CBS 118893) TaxID=535722 RepID=E4USJ1_ARTGP|nr:EF hand domain-containing protein [Nannizzia gypsea CBS 118893]EFR01342.1 EF hand domain-containing protein [Nannizzia gypsea CBS 118893]
MADPAQHPNLNLTPEEKRVFYQLFQTADKTNLGVITGETAVSFFEKTNLAPETLGLIWQIADTQNRGLLTPSGFGIVMRLIGHAQAGRHPTEELALQPGPLPNFSGLNIDVPTATSPPPTGPPLRVPPLNPDDVAKFSALFNKSDTQNGYISGETAKQIFERARLPNEILGRIWNLADSMQRGALDATEFIIAMHLLTAYKSGALRGIPQSLPPGLYEAAARRVVARNSTGSRSIPDVPPVPAIPKQFSGSSHVPRAQSPLSQVHTGSDWLISPQDKAHFDSVFSTVDKARSGYINGDQAVGFFTNARLPEEVLAHIWDLSDIDSDGQLSRDEFAVAMYLVRQQRTTKEPLPQTLPPNLIPPSMRRIGARTIQPQTTGARSASEDLFGLDVFTAPTQVAQSTGGSGSQFQPPSSPTRQPPSSTFKPFVPASSFGQSLGPIAAGRPATGAQSTTPSPSDDLLGDADPEESKKLTQDTTDLANLSNQVGTLSKEMQNIQTKRSTAEQDIGQVDQQKKDFEARLAQARAMYENEVKSLKALEEQLATSRAESKRLEQEFSLIEASRRDLATQYNQVAAALEADQRENASLKEKIKQANAQTTQLKPQLEKAKSEARQQKGLVAINKKQLATVEAERDRLQEELDQHSQPNEGSERDVTAPGSHNSPFESPAASTGSQAKNPFFRRGTGVSSPGTLSPQATGQKQQPNDNRSVFDNMFGSSFAPSTTSTPPPQTTFRAASPRSGASTPDASRNASGSFTPSAAFDTQFGAAAEPPAPPLSRQITPNNLPLEGHIASTTSSNRPSPPASRFDTSGISEADALRKQSSPFDEEPGDEAAGPAGVTAKSPEPVLPGAFPTNTTPQPDTKKEISFDELFGGVAHARSPSQNASDFEEAFASMKKPAGSTEVDKDKSNGSAAVAGSNEFPPIREFDDDDDSSEDDHAGFDDDFAPASPPRDTASTSQEQSKNAAPQSAFPPVESLGKPMSPPPGPGAQNTPPEFKGLVPGRHDPTAAGDAPHSVESTTKDPIIGGVPQHDTTNKKPTNPDFEAAFAGLDLAPAQEVEDDSDEDAFESPFNKDASNFDMSFDTTSGQTKSANNPSNADFFSFQPSADATTSANNKSPFSSEAPPAVPGKNASSNHDWDALFSTLDSTKAAATANKDGDNQAATESASAMSFPQPPSQNKPAGWALDSSTGEDDMILQRLTGMGYPRDEALAALEKFDYKLDEAADFLASKS